MNNLDVEELKKLLHKSVSERIYIHCLKTMELSMKLAKHHGVSEKKAAIAGLLHDCGKLKGKSIGNLEHANVGYEKAKSEYGVLDESILNAILYHTTGRKSMTMLEKIIFIADKSEPDRKYEKVDKIRELMYTDIDRAIVKSLESTFSYLKQNNIEIDKTSYDTYEDLK